MQFLEVDNCGGGNTCGPCPPRALPQDLPKWKV
jgi:hypothetical protein